MRKFYYCKVFFFILFPFILLGQNKSNLSELSYKEIKQLYFEPKNKSMQASYANAYLQKAKKDNKPMQIAKAYYMFSLINKETKAISYLDSVIKYSKNENDPFFPVSAFCEKAAILEKSYKFKEAINCYLVAEKYSLDNDKKEDYNRIRLSVALLKSEHLGEVDEAMIMYKECLMFYKDKDVRNPINSNLYQRVLFAIADAHKSLKQLDSASYYNRLGYNEANITKNEIVKYLFTLNEGANLVLKKKYSIAVDSINKALPKMIFFENKMNTLASYYYLGKAYEGMKQNETALINFVRVDSIYKQENNISPEFIGGYKFLVDYYKHSGNKEKEIEYLNTFTSIDNQLHENYKQMYKLVKEQHDIPELIKEKEELIISLKGNNKYSYWGIGVLLAIVILLASFSYYQLQQKKNYRVKFEKIIADANQSIKYNNETETINNYDKKVLDISEEQANHILNKLKAFESKKDFLNSTVTAQSLSQEFDTNSTYLSKVINHYKGKNFSQYLNDLRIDYAIINIQNDKDFKKYTISALANEFGYNSAESFSSAFYKKTGIKPSYFIKELEKK